MYYRLFSKIYKIGAIQMCKDCKDYIEKGSKILDFGCGSGIVAKEFEKFFSAKVVGVDIKDNRIIKIPFFKIKDGEKLPFKDNSFDVVLLSYVLHHTLNSEKILQEAKRVGKKIIVFEDLPEGILSKLRCKFHQITFFGGDRKNYNFKKSKEWEKIFAKLGLEMIVKKPVFTTFDFLDPVKKILFVLKS
jgi:ubiquinone/menaquinone biosynthesis C-methylase UbiE